MGVVRATRNTTGLESMSKALADVLDTVAQIKEMRGQREINNAVMQAAAMQTDPATGDRSTPESRRSAATQSVTDLRQNQTSDGLLSGILSAFDPRVPSYNSMAPIESLMGGEAVRDMFGSEADQAYRQSRLDSERARASNYWMGSYNDATDRVRILESEDPETYADQINMAKSVMAEAEFNLRGLRTRPPSTPGMGSVDTRTMAAPKIGNDTPIPARTAPLLAASPGAAPPFIGPPGTVTPVPASTAPTVSLGAPAPNIQGPPAPLPLGATPAGMGAPTHDQLLEAYAVNHIMPAYGQAVRLPQGKEAADELQAVLDKIKEVMESGTPADKVHILTALAKEYGDIQ